MERRRSQSEVDIENIIINKLGYTVNRDSLASLALPFLEKKRGLFVDPPRILEIGIGQGNAVVKLLKSHPSIVPSQIVGTSLQYLPEHERLTSIGVGVVYCSSATVPALGKFDIIMASAVFQHVPNIDFWVGSMIRSSNNRTVFLFMDDKKTQRRLSSAMKKYSDIVKTIEVQDVRSDTLTSFGFARFN